METKHGTSTIVWTDEDNRHSFLLALPEYGLKLLLAEDIDDDSTEIVVYGSEDDLSRFLADFDEDAIEPLESMSASLEFDEDYEGWLNNEVWWQKQLMAYDGADVL